LVNMADIKPAQKGLFLRKSELRRGIELLFFAYRDFTAEADRVLAGYGLGRAHHRVIYFVARQPDITVSELLAILGITKQSLARVLSHLVAERFVEQRAGTHDRRQRLLRLTPQGAALEAMLTDLQCKRFAETYNAGGAESVAGFTQILRGLLDEPTRAQLLKRSPDHGD